MKNPVFITNEDIELCTKYSDFPDKLEAIIKNDSFQWGKIMTGGRTNEYGSFYKYKIEIEYRGRELSFDFNDSIANKTEGKTPNLYDVLCCVRSDYSIARDYPVLDDFAQEFCLSKMKISEILEAHTKAIRFAQDISRVFTEEEIESFPS